MADEFCPVCDGEPRVLVVMRHPTMLRFTRELLEREFGCWVAAEACTDDALARALDEFAPDLLVVDAGTFSARFLSALAHIRHDRVIVIGPEPDPSYRAAALANGAGGWLPRERVGEELAREMRRVLGCVHDPCPPGQRGRHRGSPRVRESPSRPDVDEATRARTIDPGGATEREAPEVVGRSDEAHGTARVIEVILVEAEACHLCEDAGRTLDDASCEYPVAVRRVNVTSPEGRAIVDAHRAPMVPVVVVEGRLLGWGRLSRGKLRRRLDELVARDDGR